MMTTKIANNVPQGCVTCGRPFKDRKDWNDHCVPDDCLTHIIGYSGALEKKIHRLNKQISCIPDLREQQDELKAENDKLKKKLEELEALFSGRWEDNGDDPPPMF